MVLQRHITETLKKREVELRNEFSKVAAYKINIQKLTVLSHTLCNENFRTLLKEIEENIQKKKGILSFWIRMTNTVKMFRSYKMTCSFNTNRNVKTNTERANLGFEITMEQYLWAYL